MWDCGWERPGSPPKMREDFTSEYSHRSDDELLHLASGRGSLTTEAATALDAELHRRNLTESDRVEFQRFVKRQEQREARKGRPKPFGTFKARFTWVDTLLTLLPTALISFAYFALPSRYHLTSDWEDAAAYAMIVSIGIVVGSRRDLWRKRVFWISLVISSAIYLVVVHLWTYQVPYPPHSARKGALVLGFLLFFGVYSFVSILRRIFYGKEASDNSKIVG